MSRAALRQIVPVAQTTVFDAYISGLAPSGRRGITSLLNRSARILKRGADADNYPWEELNFAAVAKVRAALLDDVTPCHLSTWRCLQCGAWRRRPSI